MFEKFRHKDIVPHFDANLAVSSCDREDPPQDVVFYGGSPCFMDR